MEQYRNLCQKMMIAKQKKTKEKANKPYKITLPHGDSWVMVFPVIPKEIQMDENLFEDIWNLHPKEKGKGIIMGKEIEFPRWQESYGQAYSFTGMTHKAHKIKHTFMKSILEWVCNDSQKKYKQILVNWYENGNHYIGPHSDDEKQLVKKSAIYSFSFGQERDFVIKSKDKTYRKVVKMPHNSLLVMCGEMQKYYKHSVPKRALSKCPKKRINITMRLFE
jgi:alkylated DNA repair dioxygenase AlkB